MIHTSLSLWKLLSSLTNTPKRWTGWLFARLHRPLFLHITLFANDETWNNYLHVNCNVSVKFNVISHFLGDIEKIIEYINSTSRDFEKFRNSEHRRINVSTFVSLTARPTQFSYACTPQQNRKKKSTGTLRYRDAHNKKEEKEMPTRWLHGVSKPARRCSRALSARSDGRFINSFVSDGRAAIHQSILCCKLQ